MRFALQYEYIYIYICNVHFCKTLNAYFADNFAIRIQLLYETRLPAVIIMNKKFEFNALIGIYMCVRNIFFLYILYDNL